LHERNCNKLKAYLQLETAKYIISQMTAELTTQLRGLNESTLHYLRMATQRFRIARCATPDGPRAFEKQGYFDMYDPLWKERQGFRYIPMWSRKLLNYDPAVVDLNTSTGSYLRIIPRDSREGLNFLDPSEIRLVRREVIYTKKVFPSGYLHLEKGGLEINGIWFNSTSLDQLLIDVEQKGIVPPKRLPFNFVKVDPSLEGQSFVVIVTHLIDNPHMTHDLIVLDVQSRRLIPRSITQPLMATV
jgi:hypothetical protein